MELCTISGNTSIAVVAFKSKCLEPGNLFQTFPYQISTEACFLDLRIRSINSVSCHHQSLHPHKHRSTNNHDLCMIFQEQIQNHRLKPFNLDNRKNTLNPR
ncbi:hypothetical protein Peur_054910 [Populus x canadensis]